ncbi:MAG: MFS transporter [Arenicellales bacterium]
MTRSQLGIVLFTTFLTFCTLYTPQPILPQLVTEFGVPMSDAALLITVTLLPLGLAPIFYGYFLQAVPARSMLQIALVLLIVDQAALFFATEFWQLLTLRFIQGLLLPALFTSLMTYCATMSSPTALRRNMGLYVAATILGGFSSRVLSGYLASTLGWQWVFLLLGVALIIPLLLTNKIDADAEVNFSRLDRKAIGRVLAVPNYTFAYLTLFAIFFVFLGILSLLPFRIKEIDPNASSFLISMVYFGYIIGIPTAIMSEGLVKRMNSEQKVLIAAVIANIIALVTYLAPQLAILFIMMLFLAGAMFLIHATLSGYVNHIAKEHKGVVNGIYVSVYYLSGTLGSWLPVLLYRHLGWQAVIVFSISILALSIHFIRKLTTPANIASPSSS